MSGSEDKSRCPECGSYDKIYSRDVRLPIIDEETGRVLKTVEFQEYKCKRCKCVWREKW